MASSRRNNPALAVFSSIIFVIAVLLCSCSTATTTPTAPEAQVGSDVTETTPRDLPSVTDPLPSSTSPPASQLRSTATEAAPADTPTVSEPSPTSDPASTQVAKHQIPDQEQPAIDMTNQTVVGGVPEQSFAQVFTLSQTGTITSLGLPLNCQPVARLSVQIVVARDGTPSDQVLVSEVFSGSALSAFLGGANEDFTMIAFRNPPPVSAGQLYAFVLETEGGDCNLYWGPPGDSYPEGTAYFIQSGHPPGWREILNPVRDLAFQVFTAE